jgi:peroxiredoxin
MSRFARPRFSLGRRRFIATLGTVGVAVVMGRAHAASLEALSRVLVEVRPPATPPSFSFTTADGARQTLADYRGKGVVLNVWATWCVPCIAEMPALDDFAASARKVGIVVLPVSIDTRGLPAVRKFYDSHRIENLPILVDPDGKVLQALRISGIPASFVVDRAGRIAGYLEGPVQWDAPEAIASIQALVGPDLQAG